MEPPSTSHRFSAGLVIVTAWIAVYFLCPVLLVWPLTKVYKHRGPSRYEMAILEFVFAPIDFLDKKVPAYHRLLAIEREFLSRP